MNNIPPHFKKREPDPSRDNLDRIKMIFPGIPQEQIERAKKYKMTRIQFVKTLSPALSESDRLFQISLFSREYWKIDED
jgi:hypothetical protein